MKFFINAGIGKFLILIFAAGIHAAFGFGAYYLGLFLANLVLSESGGIGAQIAAVLYALAIFLGSVWAFMYGEYAREDIAAYQRVNGGHKHLALSVLLVFIGLNELGSLGFRLTQVHDPYQRLWLGVVGVVLLAIAYLLGKVIHAMANKPLAVQTRRMLEEVRRSTVDDLSKYAPKLPLNKRLELLQGNTDVLKEAHDATEAERQQDEEWRRQEKERKRQEKEDRSNARHTRMLEESREDEFAGGLVNNLLGTPGYEERPVPFNRTRQA